MSRTRRVKSIKNELIQKSQEAMLAAVQIYNNPQITFKAEAFISLAAISWTYLLHAFYRGERINYRYYRLEGRRKRYDKTKYGAYKHWELERCLNDAACPLDSETITNLKFLIGIRHEIEHQMTERIDEFLSAKLQACAMNFDYYITKIFGGKYKLSDKLSLAIQFSPISLEQQKNLKGNHHITTNIINFVVNFEEHLSEDILKSSKYAYRILFMPITANRKGQADQVIEFIKSDSPLAGELEKTYTVIKETERKKYLPSEIVHNMKEKGYTKFSINKHAEFWKDKDAKNPRNQYGVMVAKTWYWYEKWVKEVEQYCQVNKEIFCD